MAEQTLIPVTIPDLRGNEAKYLAECVRDNWVSSAGPFVTEMERRMAALSGRAHAVATVNGTTAIELALRGMGVGAGDLVAVPDWTFAATANAVIHAGAVPLFMDVTAATWTFDPALLLAARDQYGDRIRAAVPVHALGHPADMDAILAACGGQLPVIEDAAGAIGASYKGRPTGGLGHAAIFSFNGNKTVTAGGGGMVVTEDENLARTVRHLSTQARLGDEYRHDAAGFNYRMTNLNAAVGLAQLERLDEMVAAKRAVATRYDRALTGRDDLMTMPRANWAESGCWIYSVITASKADARSLVAALSAKRIEARIFWQSLSAQEPYRAYPRLLTGVSARLSGAVVSLPCSSHLTAADQDRVIAVLAAWRGAVHDAAA